jgi:hypothetical protein
MGAAEASGGASDVSVSEWQRASGTPHCQQPKKTCIMSVPNLVGHGFVTFGSAWAKLMDIKRNSIWTVLVLAKVKALKEPQQQKTDPVEF